MSAVLVVEDEESMALALADALSGAGLRVFWAKSAEEAAASLERQKIDLIYLDTTLVARSDGYALLRQLKAHDSKHRHIPVILLSGQNQMGEMHKAEKMGADDDVVKSKASVADLVAMTKRTLGLA